MEKLIYDADRISVYGELCAGGHCPKFVMDEERQIVSLIDKQGNRADMSVEHFNRFVKAARTGKIKELAAIKRK